MLSKVENKLSMILKSGQAQLVASGTYGLVLSLKALDLPPASSVIIPAICCSSVSTAVQLAGLSVKICDVDRVTLCAEVEQIEPCIDDSVSAIIAVHAFGTSCNIEAISKLTSKKGIALIEDACLSYGNSFNGKMLGGFGDCAVISFGHEKPLDIGYGGAILTRKIELAKRIETLKKKIH